MDQTLTDTLKQMVGSRAVFWLTQLAVGLGLLYAIDKFFKLVEEKLADDTKLEIAVWLVGVKVGQRLEPWPETFARVFDRVFGTKHLSWKCFWRSCLASFALVLMSLLTFSASGNSQLVIVWREVVLVLCAILLGNALPDYLSLLESRICLRIMTITDSGIWTMLVLVVDFCLTNCIAITGYTMSVGIILSGSDWASPTHVDSATFPSLTVWASAITYPFTRLRPHDLYTAIRFAWSDTFKATTNSTFMFFIPAFFTSIWLWLYAGSGFLLKAARRFDLGFDWFNRKFDIEKKPLQSIGLVAGALVAVVYWTAVIVSRMIG